MVPVHIKVITVYDESHEAGQNDLRRTVSIASIRIDLMVAHSSADSVYME